MRRDLEPVDAGPGATDGSVREALAVHYFPGMWSWDRSIVRPLVLKAAGAAAPFVERYVDWAERVDDFEPLRVEFDYDARVPDPDGNGDLAAPDGRAVHYVGRANALVVDHDRAHWLLIHRLGPWTPPEVLQLDEEAVTTAWAWEHTFLDAKIQGVLYNELTPDARFRRTRRTALTGRHRSRRRAARARDRGDARSRSRDVSHTFTGLRELCLPGAVHRDAGRG